MKVHISTTRDGRRKEDLQRLILTPENESDIFTLGKLSAKIACVTNMTSSTDNPERKVNFTSMEIKELFRILESF